ncbi:Uncharacterized ACR, COG1678 [Seminavis robusta]|uniref:Uncharacterized ACR, COG1678 n=1 Tax=Seminavis robusta TaxID=568900 RepID=A0A9N8DP62_9STRA|nr:Uncharacterized ACR, COG1678 [Seminavis robusta]|eukprot:Sro271_g104560.1 Uncharacterized ACR, COG1678 (472) ;mRNA; r:39034-40708
MSSNNSRLAAPSLALGALLLTSTLLLCLQLDHVEGFVPLSTTITAANKRCSEQIATRQGRLYYSASSFYDMDEDDDEDDDDDDMIDPDSLGDWRDFRRNLAQSELSMQEGTDESSSSTVLSSVRTSVSKENEQVLFSQNEDLAEEFKNGAWAHEISTPEVGGLIVRMPIEVELYRNHRHSIVGRKLRKMYDDTLDLDDAKAWYRKAQLLVEDSMSEIASTADDSGQIDSTSLSDESTEMLQIFLDNQDTWQEVCLVVERDEDMGRAKALVLNRPMAMKLTENLSRLVLYGAFQRTGQEQDSHVKKDLVKFMLAFGNEAAVYVGGTDNQDEAATMIHGIKDLPGAREISPGIYEGGLEAAIDGVLEGKYNPLEFRFFVGCHNYEESTLDVAVVLGKYQPLACARSVALKQCISLPKPLWHEVLELCGGDMEEVSKLEMLKRDDILFQVIDEDDEDLLDELALDDDEDDYYDD